MVWNETWIKFLDDCKCLATILFFAFGNYRNILNLESIGWDSISKENPIVLSKINKGELIFKKIEDEEIDLQLQKLNESK